MKLGQQLDQSKENSNTKSKVFKPGLDKKKKMKVAILQCWESQEQWMWQK